MPTAWDNEDFVSVWNETYGIDMAKAPIRGEFVFPWIKREMGPSQNLRLIDLGCGNGNLIRHFLDARLGIDELVGVDPGSAVIRSAQESITDPRAQFVHASASEKFPYAETGRSFDVVTSVFVVEEIPAGEFQKYCDNAASLMRPGALAFIFTNHPANALAEDLTSHLTGKPNTKFVDHQGYFDTAPNAYTLEIMNGQRGHKEKAAYHHKPVATILNAFAQAGLSLRSMVEVPRGITSLPEYEAHTPKSGDVPRFAGFTFQKN